MITSNKQVEKMPIRQRADDDTSGLPAVKSSLLSLDGQLWLFTGQGDRVVVKLDKEEPDVFIAARYLSFPPGSRILVMNGQKGHVALGLAISNPECNFEVLETHLGNVEIIKRNLVANYSVRNLKLVADVDQETLFQAVVYPVSGYTALSIVEDTICIGGSKLAKNAPFYLIGNTKNGVERHAGILAEKIGETNLSKIKKGVRIYEALLSKRISQSDIYRKIAFDVLGHHFEVETAAGLFSKDNLDIGTRFLLESVPTTPFERLLDAACGWGAIGIVKSANSTGEIVMSDIDTRATKCAAHNAKVLGLEGRVSVVATDDLKQIEGSFDLILSNPPFHAETNELVGLFEGIRDKLAKRGEFYFVVHETYVKKLTDIGSLVFRQVTEFAHDDLIQFRVFKVRK